MLMLPISSRRLMPEAQHTSKAETAGTISRYRYQYMSCRKACASERRPVLDLGLWSQCSFSGKIAPVGHRNIPNVNASISPISSRSARSLSHPQDSVVSYVIIAPVSTGDSGVTTDENMRDPHPLAIIPLQRDLLISETSSTSSSGSSPSCGPDAPSVNIRSLVPTSTTSRPAAAGDKALMRSLISVLPHERADSQFSVALPVRRSHGDSNVRSEPSTGARTKTAFGYGHEENNCSGSGEGESRAGPRDASSAVPATGGLADPGLDFLGTTDSVRDLMHLPYTSEAVTVGVHRVGQTLILDGNLGEVLNPGAATASPASTKQEGSGQTRHASDDSDSLNCSGDGTARARSPDSAPRRSSRQGPHSDGIQEDRWVMVGKGGRPQREGHPRETSASAPRGAASVRVDQRLIATDVAGKGGGVLVNRTSWPALGGPAALSASEDVANVGSGILSVVPSRSRASSLGSRPPEPAGFWRAFQWELAGMRLMLGSNLQVCGTSEHPQVSVRLHDSDEDLSLCTCLDYYLDNVMENVPELALCMREKGYIQGCRLVSTEDIPYLGSLCRAGREPTAAVTPGTRAGGGIQEGEPLFDPGVVELNATILLRFLQENCSREGGTYLLHRSEGSAHVQLYDVSALSRQRNRRWKWLLAMLCYRFALRISDHIRQPWCRGRSGGRSNRKRSSSDPVAADAGSVSPGPEVVRQLQRRQRQLLDNSLKLLEELAQLGGSGHEIICASVQEHIADTYLGYGVAQGALSGGAEGETTVSSATNGARRSDASGRAKQKTTKRAPAAWTVDSDGSVYTHPPPAAATVADQRKGMPRADARRKAARQNVVSRTGDGRGRRYDLPANGVHSPHNAGAIWPPEENLDKAQDHLTSGITILRGVMAKQEAAAEGRDGSTADVVIVGEKGVPVGVMRQPRHPWLAVDDDDDDDDDYKVEEAGRREGLPREGRSENERLPRSGGRGGSRDESEDPATALSVVSEQLFGLQQKLIGTYVDVARARLSRAVPGSIAAAMALTSSSGVQLGGGGDTLGGGREGFDEAPDEETSAQLLAGALDALKDAWEHTRDAQATIDRRAAAILLPTSHQRGGAGGVHRPPQRQDNREVARLRETTSSGLGQGHASSLHKGREEDVGFLWKGSLSEALARSSPDDDDTSAPRESRDQESSASATTRPAPAGPASGSDGLAKAPSSQAQDDTAALAWNVAALHRLRLRRAELFELCGDASYTCAALRAGAAVDTTNLLTGLVAKLDDVLSHAQPALSLDGLDVCQDVHGRVWEALTEGLNPHGTAKGSAGGFDSKSSIGTNKGGSGSGTGTGDNRTTGAATVDPDLLSKACVHSLMKQGQISADSIAWSLHLAVEACYAQALSELPNTPAPLQRGLSSAGLGACRGCGSAWGEDTSGGVSDARGRLTKKRGDASNELGKLMAQCAASLVQLPSASGASQPAVAAGPPEKEPQSTADPGLACAICVACAEKWFQSSLRDFKAINDPRNIALLCCNLASVERMKPRAFSRVVAVLPALAALWSGAAHQRDSSTGKRGGRTRERGAMKAIELCGEAHAALGRRESDVRTWDQASSELAMAYLCLGVERRQGLLSALQDTGAHRVGTPSTANDVVAVSSRDSKMFPPATAQARRILEPLEQALQIYTDMNNAPQAAACHYQIGQFYSKVLPAYLPSTKSSEPRPRSALEDSSSEASGRNDSCENVGYSAPQSAMDRAKAWEMGQLASRHFLAARAYFAPFERGPTSVVLALDLCDLYLSLADIDAAFRPSLASFPHKSSPASGVADVVPDTSVIPIPTSSVGDVQTRGSTSPGVKDHRVRPARAVRMQCLHGALRSVLETRFVFSGANSDGRSSQAPDGESEGRAVVGGGTAATTTSPSPRLLRLLEAVVERLPKIMRGLVQESVQFDAKGELFETFKRMYKMSLTGSRSGGYEAQALLAGLAKEYASVGRALPDEIAV